MSIKNDSTEEKEIIAITYRPIFSRLLGSCSAAILLSFIWENTIQGHKSFCIIDKPLADWLCMTAKEFRLAKKKVADSGLVKITREGIPAKTVYSLNDIALANRLEDMS